MPESQKVPATCLWYYILISDAFNYLFAQWMHYLSWNYHATPVYTNYPCVYQLRYEQNPDLTVCPNIPVELIKKTKNHHNDHIRSEKFKLK